ncbi:MAG: hypothetical protein ACTSPT_04750, partial [Candidatus Heimdallarchaeota archaeon]
MNIILLGEQFFRGWNNMLHDVIEPMSNALELMKKYMLIDGYELVFDLEKSTSNYIYDKISNR